MAKPKDECVDCGATAPPLEEEQTLRSQMGWRLTFEKAPDGSNVPTWRCPKCWQRKKGASRPDV